MADKLENLRCLYERDNTTSGRMIWSLAQERKDLQDRVAELTLELDSWKEVVDDIARLGLGLSEKWRETTDDLVSEMVAGLRQERDQIRERLTNEIGLRITTEILLEERGGPKASSTLAGES